MEEVVLRWNGQSNRQEGKINYFYFILCAYPIINFAHLGCNEVEDAFRRNTLDVLALFIVDEELSADDIAVKMISSKMEEATMMGSRRLDSKRARLYTIKELGIMAHNAQHLLTLAFEADLIGHTA